MVCKRMAGLLKPGLLNSPRLLRTNRKGIFPARWEAKGQVKNEHLLHGLQENGRSFIAWPSKAVWNQQKMNSACKVASKRSLDFVWTNQNETLVAWRARKWPDFQSL